MQIRFDGKTVIVAGAARGIGRAITRAFAADGGNVFATYACPSASPIKPSVAWRQRFQRGRSAFAPVKRRLNSKFSFTNGVLSQGDASRFLARVSQAGTAALTMFRLQMETLEAVLPNKQVVIADDKNGGKRSWILFSGSGLVKVLNDEQ